jgi:hypothetical protein
MDTGFRRLGPGHSIVRVPIDSAATSITVREGEADKVVDVISLSLSASAAGTIGLLADATNRLPHTFGTNNLDWTLPRNADAWMECTQMQTLRIQNTGAVTLKGVIVLLVMDAA